MVAIVDDESMIAFPDSSVRAWICNKVKLGGALMVTFWLLTPRPRESNKNTVMRIFSKPSALA